ncbi:nucleoside recognition protein [Haloarcula rubripromontorii]|uniref:Nucleoside recognition protein n=1 Tax=Haloarcula rubripromontorii TaxID=1705562 RepID=A0A0N0BQ10_9EURY|nr:nucleoside recognition protein [Haloarcula rubripromontorii]KOX94724.1 nucleoside recognition protein [Haloarcula rubripromontorii]NLV07678.1 nucleoside recognition protein [Haloarcula rubripromontorii]
MQSLVAAVLGHPAVSVLGEVAVRVLRITVFLSLGVFLAELAVAFGLVEKIAVVSRYLTSPANLPDEVGTAILTTTASTTAGYGMLADFRESGALSDRATLVAVTINTFFGFAQHIITFYAPILIPILGFRVGVLYVTTRGLIALAITLTGIAAGAVLLDPANVGRSAAGAGPAPDGGTADDPGDVFDERPATRRAAVRTAFDATAEKVRDILPRLAAIYAVVSLLVAYGDELLALAGSDGASVTAAADGFAGLLGLPGAAIPVIAAYALDTTSGATVIAPLIRNGTFTARTAVATMLVGGIISFAVSTFKRSIPFQYGIWGREFGSKVIVVNTGLKIVWIALALVVLL